MADCLFCKIRDGLQPADIVYQDEQVVAFRDLRPQAPLHDLVIPREHIATLNDLGPEHRELIGHMHLVAARLAREAGFAESGYRTVLNCNRGGGQTVFHLHLHVIGGGRFHLSGG
ncbi:MAG: histidine triad nucleotide-binding protein [Deltaproteobacteria bacterium]|nr:histidine triad nucleotide-binding protein [Deltaproteobacteria bacterium]